MKRIIDGLVYDTEKAEVVADYYYSHKGDFNYIKEKLYKTSNGRYFLYGEGGPKTEYFENVGNGSYSGGNMIIPLTKEGALDWVERREIDEKKILEELSEVLDEA